MKKYKVKKPLTGIRLFIKELWDLLIERNKVHKALRLMSKQEWSVEFLSALLVRASRMRGIPLEMTLVSPDGTRIIVKTEQAEQIMGMRDETIFDRLDSEVAIKSFIDSLKG